MVHHHFHKSLILNANCSPEKFRRRVRVVAIINISQKKPISSLVVCPGKGGRSICKGRQIKQVKLTSVVKQEGKLSAPADALASMPSRLMLSVIAGCRQDSVDEKAYS